MCTCGIVAGSLGVGAHGWLPTLAVWISKGHSRGNGDIAKERFWLPVRVFRGWCPPDIDQLVSATSPIRDELRQELIGSIDRDVDFLPLDFQPEDD
jgi:hypothetical protein